MKPADTPTPVVLQEKRFRSLSAIRLRESFIKAGLIFCAAFSVIVTIAIICLLFYESGKFFGFVEVAGIESVSLGEFFSGLRWEPSAKNDPHFGVWPLICGTLLVTFIAMVVALPTGLISAVFLSEYAPRWLRDIVKPVLEILAGIPTVVFGFFACAVVTPFLMEYVGPVFQVSPVDWFVPDGNFDSFNALSAGLMVGVLCLPTVASLSEDAIRSVPNRLREAAFSLGGTRFDVSIKVIVPAALSGIISAFLLAIARAIGETMIVTLAAGAKAQMTLDPRDSVQTMTGHITTVAKGDISNFGVSYYSIYAVGATLFVMTFILTVIGHLVRRRFREAYE